MSRKKRIFFITILVIAVTAVGYFQSTTPSNNRNWAEDQTTLPYADINGNEIQVKNIRNFRYTSPTTYTPNYYDKVFNIGELKNVYYIVVPFQETGGAAHTMLSFEFEDDEFLAVSVEIRKEKDEEFSIWKGLLDKYEIMYVVADEEDVIKLRTNYRRNDVYMYPIKSEKEKLQELFLDIMARVNKLKEKPEFYNTVTNNCTNNIVKHVNNISPKRIPWGIEILFPAYSDRLAYELGLIDTVLSFEDARQKFNISQKARQLKENENFSLKIRES